jgi:hypothetical protein
MQIVEQQKAGDQFVRGEFANRSLAGITHIKDDTRHSLESSPLELENCPHQGTRRLAISLIRHFVQLAY